MIRVKKVTIKGFRQFREESSVELPESGLVLIRGKNNDTGGSSGSGKSTIMHAISYALGFCPFPATALQNWYSNEKMQVTVELDTHEGPVVVKRGAETSLTINGEVVKGSVRAVDERLRQLLGLPNDLLKALTYRPQDEPGLFLSMTDAERKEFLSQLLDLKELEGISDAARKAANDLLSKAEQIERSAAYISSQIQGIDLSKPTPTPGYENAEKVIADLEAKESLARKEMEEAAAAAKAIQEEKNAVIRQLTAEANAAKQAIDTKINELRANRKPFASALQPELDKAVARVEAAKARLQTVLHEADETRKKISQDLQERTNRAAEYRAQIARLPEMRKRAEQLAKEIEICKSATCPTCSQTWITEGAQKHMESLQSELQNLLSTINQLEKVEVSWPKIEEALRQQQNALATYQHPDHATAQNELNEAENACQAIRVAMATERQEWEAKEREKESALVLERSNIAEEWSEKIQKATQTYDHRYEPLNTLAFEKAEAARKAADELAKYKLAAMNAKKADEVALAAWKERVEQHKKLTAELDRLNSEIRDLRQRAAAESDFAALVGREGFLGAVFDEVLAEISQETNELLKGLPNVANTTLTFVSESETAKGTVSRKIVPVVMKNGVEIPLKAGLSGGQYTSVQLAVDLAVATVIGRRTGKMLGFLMLDECFNGHDFPVKEACLDILQRAAEKRLILIVDHATELKEMFTAFVDVESTNDESRIV